MGRNRNPFFFWPLVWSLLKRISSSNDERSEIFTPTHHWTIRGRHEEPSSMEEALPTEGFCNIEQFTCRSTVHHSETSWKERERKKEKDEKTFLCSDFRLLQPFQRYHQLFPFHSSFYAFKSQASAGNRTSRSWGPFLVKISVKWLYRFYLLWVWVLQKGWPEMIEHEPMSQSSECWAKDWRKRYANEINHLHASMILRSTASGPFCAVTFSQIESKIDQKERPFIRRHPCMVAGCIVWAWKASLIQNSTSRSPVNSLINDKERAWTQQHYCLS